MGRVIAIGDVHGEATALEALLTSLGLRSEDTVIQLGDLCDRGPDTKGCFELLEEWSTVCRVEMIRGNHDELMLDCCEGVAADDDFWLAVGGRETLESYGGDVANVPEAHLQQIRDAAPYAVVGEDLLVHASVDPLRLPDEQSTEALRWKKTTGDEPPYLDFRRVVCGHTAQKSGRPKVWDGWVCIDTKAYDPGGRLTALDLAADLIFQSDQFGNVHGPVPLGVAAVAGV
ncbi:MAG: metallophosphoesterase [Planctomycetota bacterium]